MAYAPTLQDVVESSLQWIFVGGKGGVGKTTTSSSLAVLIAQTPLRISGGLKHRKVLLVSTDPAHNLSDAFDQQFNNVPSPVRGVDNLWACEVDPTVLNSRQFSLLNEADESHSGGQNYRAIMSILKQAATSFPGIDEVTVFVQILQELRSMAFDIIIFDTAPTGHTLRLLALPNTLSTVLTQLLSVQGLAALVDGAAQAVSGGSGEPLNFSAKLTEWQTMALEIQQQFADHAKTAFVCVCIPEFLSVYETERLVQELMKYNIQCSHIVVNQIVMRPSNEEPCRMCNSRQKLQQKYLTQIDDLYDEFHVVRMPLLTDEVRGVGMLVRFARYLMVPYDVDRDGYL